MDGLEFGLHAASLEALHQKRVTVYDIAEKVGVSHTTVALALRNHHRIPEARRRQIQQVAAAMGYERDPVWSNNSSVALDSPFGIDDLP